MSRSLRRSWLGAALVFVGAGWSSAGGTWAAQLPDGRGYEMVSPAGKNGADIMASSMKTRVAPDGGAVTFASLGAFGDAVGSGLEVDYASVRGPEGWRTHSLMPVQATRAVNLLFSTATPSYGAFSEDLSTGVLFALSPLTVAATVAQTHNLYRRTDILSPGDGSYDLVSASVTPQTSRASRPEVEAVSRDFTHILFSSRLNLVPGVTACPPGVIISCATKLYEWDNGAVRLAGILPNGQPAMCSNGQTCAAAGGGNLTYSTNWAMSPDGSRIFFSSSTPNGGPLADSNIYMRENHASTVQLNASERATPEAPRMARFWATSTDASKVFFTSDERLTDADGAGLYVYDASRPDSDPDNLTLLSVDEEPSDGGAVRGVIGTSDDGSYVYFIAQGQLVAGQPIDPADTIGQIYVWHNGVTRYVGALAFNDSVNDIAEVIGFSIAAGKIAQVSPDGRRLVFVARDGTYLTGYDHGRQCGEEGSRPCKEVYIYDFDGAGGVGKLTCVSCNPAAPTATADATTVTEIGRSGTVVTTYMNHPLSDDGRRVFFTSGETLVPDDDNGVVDAYEFDTVSGALHLLTPGASRGSVFIDATPDGDDVLVATRERLVGIDTDQAYDLYDVRVGGGIAAQNPPAAPAECSGEACHGGASAPADDVTPKRTEFLRGSDASQVAKLLEQLNASTGVFHVYPFSGRALRRLAAGKRAGVRVDVSDPGRVHVRVRASAAGDGLVARADRVFGQGGLARLKLRLSSGGLEQLRRVGVLRVKVVVTYSKAFVAQRATLTLRQLDGGRR